QLVAPHDRGVIEAVNEIRDPSPVRLAAESVDSGDGGRLHMMGREMDEAYLQAVLALSIRPEVVSQQKEMKIVYSPIHGTGVTLVPQLLECWGFRQVKVVDKQASPDGSFPTVVY